MLVYLETTSTKDTIKCPGLTQSTQKEWQIYTFDKYEESFASVKKIERDPKTYGG